MLEISWFVAEKDYSDRKPPNSDLFSRVWLQLRLICTKSAVDRIHSESWYPKPIVQTNELLGEFLQIHFNFIFFEVEVGFSVLVEQFRFLVILVYVLKRQESQEVKAVKLVSVWQTHERAGSCRF